MDHSDVLGLKKLICPPGTPQQISEMYDLVNKEISLAKASADDIDKNLHLINVKMLICGITAITDKFESIKRVTSIADKFHSSLQTGEDLTTVKDNLGVAINEAQKHWIDYERRIGNLEFQVTMSEYENQRLAVEITKLKIEMKEFTVEIADSKDALKKAKTKIDKLERQLELLQDGFCVINSSDIHS